LAARHISPEDDAPRGNYRIALWEPPVSPFGLIEEQVYHDPWRLLVACMLLNKTSGVQVRKVLWELFTYAPTAEAAVKADVAKVEAMIRPLGLFRKRAVMFKRFSQEYLEKEWTDPQELHGIGQYAADAYYIFCRGEWRDRAKPADKDLLKYFLWLQQTDGLGTGLTPDVWPHNSPATSKQTQQADSHTEPSAATEAQQAAPLAEVTTTHANAGRAEDEAAAAVVAKSDGTQQAECEV
jgi:methyl-CpG-binding domain protein 4